MRRRGQAPLLIAAVVCAGSTVSDSSLVASGDESARPLAVTEVAPDAAPRDGEALTAGPGITLPKLVLKVPPAYPESARLKRVEGRVILQAVIDREGRVADVKVLRSTDKRFDAASVRAVRKWRYEPAHEGGVPITV